MSILSLLSNWGPFAGGILSSIFGINQLEEERATARAENEKLANRGFTQLDDLRNFITGSGYSGGFGEKIQPGETAQDALARGNSRLSQAQGGLPAIVDNLLSEWRKLPEWLQGELDKSQKAWQDRYSRGMGLIDKAGAQQELDIKEAYRGQKTRAGQELASRGLTGTTILPSIQSGISREEQGALGRLQESLLQQRVATDAGLSGDWISALERGTSAGLGLQGTLLGQEQNLQTLPLNYQMQLLPVDLGFTSSIQVPYPNSNSWLDLGSGLMGMSGNLIASDRMRPQQPSIWESLGGAALGGATGAFTGGFVNPLAYGGGMAALGGLGGLFGGGSGSGAGFTPSWMNDPNWNPFAGL